MAGKNDHNGHGGEADTINAVNQAVEVEKHEHITLQEFVVLDSAGRLQIPKELLEELGIGKRAQLETGDNCIIIRPVVGQGDDGPKKMTLEDQIAMLFNDEPAPSPQKKGRGRLKLTGRK